MYLTDVTWKPEPVAEAKAADDVKVSRESKPNNKTHATDAPASS